MEKEKEKKAKKLKELFVQDLARIQGGTGVAKKPKCPEVTTLACGEEGTCSGC
jgi:molybdopterin biosynthesis enzyme MoaB